MRFIRTLSLLLLLAISPAFASDHKFQFVFGQGALDGQTLSGAEFDEDSSSYAFRYLRQSSLGWLGGGLNLERLTLDQGGGAYCLDGLVHIEGGWPFVEGYVNAGIGGVFTDQDLINTIVKDPGGELVGTTATPQQTASLRWSAEAGVQFWFSRAQRLGIGAGYTYSEPLGDGFAVDQTTAAVLYLSVGSGGS